VNYARLSGRVAHIGGFAVIGKGAALGYEDPMSELRLTYRADDDENRLGTLVVQVRSSGFVGYAESYVDLNQLIPFAINLEAYPISADTGLSYFTGQIEDEVRISVIPKTSRGHLLVTVELQHRGWWEGQQMRQTGTLQLVTDYAGLDTFRRQLGRLGEADQVEAVLIGAA
jgi:hypothetical protein